jgi:hypothetical protein
MLNISSVPLNEAVYIYLLHIYTIHRTIILSTKKRGGGIAAPLDKTTNRLLASLGFVVVLFGDAKSGVVGV